MYWFLFDPEDLPSQKKNKKTLDEVLNTARHPQLLCAFSLPAWKIHKV